jgi:replicative DNA helicase
MNAPAQQFSPDRSAVFNIEAEQALLGALMANNDALAFMGVQLDPRHFSEPLHGRLFEAIRSLIGQGRVANPITLKPHFELDSTLVEVGGMVYLARLMGAATTIVNAPEYARLIVDLAIRREAIDVAATAITDLQALPVDQTGEQYVSDLAREFSELSEEGEARRSSYGAEAVMVQAIDEAASAYQHDGKRPDALPTGLAALDDRIGGFVRGDLIVIGARPSMGKTALGLQLMANVATRSTPALFASLEMKSVKLGHRLLAMKTGIPFSRIEWGRFSEREFDIITEASRGLAQWPFAIEDRSGLSLSQLEAAIARQKVRRPGLALVVVDYLALMSPGDRYRGRKVDELGEISAGLKRIAKTADVVLVALHQLSREVERRDNKRPILADLRDSGSIEQDADAVLFIYREEYYLTREEPKADTSEYIDWQTKLRACAGLCEIVIAKNRQGPIGLAKLAYDPPTNRFTDLAAPALQEDFL